MNATRTITYLRLDDIREAEINPKQHDLDAVRASVVRYGFVTPGLRDDRTGRLIAGHGRTLVLRGMHAAGQPAPEGVQVDDDGMWLAPVITGWASRDDAEAAAYLVIDNHHPTLGGWDDKALAELLGGIRDADTDLLDVIGLDDDMAALLDGLDDEHQDEREDEPAPASPPVARLTEDDAIPDTAPAITRPGDLWQLGPHRLIAGDTTDPATVARLFDGLPAATMVHADPPYGMGKESDGVLNDNLYRDQLDQFQLLWWNTWTAHLAGNGSAYIWGNAADLWRLWWRAGLAEWVAPDGTALTMRNEIVWDKGSVPGMRSAGAHMFPTATERCLFVMFGEQFLGSGTKDDYYDGNEPIRLWLCEQRDLMGWGAKAIREITGTHMAGHWFGKSQFAIIGREHYEKLRTAAAGRAFTESYDELFARLFPDAKTTAEGRRRELSEAMREGRTPFDITHDAFNDVWRYERVVGTDRHGHATPKPVAMCERALRTSSREGDVVAVPFGGSGPEFIAGHHLGRTIVAAELHPPYVDVICRRYQAHTGITPERIHLDGTREPVDFTA